MREIQASVITDTIERLCIEANQVLPDDIKKSDENPMVLELYQGLLKGKEHELLHNEFY